MRSILLKLIPVPAGGEYAHTLKRLTLKGHVHVQQLNQARLVPVYLGKLGVT
jgi:hypothetical protein